MTIDLGEEYRACRNRIGTLVGDEVADVPVPATSEWTVHDVIAHLTGVAVDGANGNMEGAPGEAWTAAQVARGRAVPLAELLATWDEHATGLEAMLSSPAGQAIAAAVMDVHTHEADLRHALGLDAVVPAAFLDWAASRLWAGFDDAVIEAGLDPVSVTMPPFEVFRGRLGRRTVAEIIAHRWSADPALYLDSWFIFGRRTTSLDEHLASI